MTHTTLVESPADPFELPDIDDGCSPLLEQVARQACRLMGADGAAVCMLDADDPRRMRVVSSRGEGDRLLGEVMASDIGLTGRVLRLAQPAVASASERFPLVGEEDPAGSHAVASCPIFLRDRLWGAVTVVATGALNHRREAALEDLGDLTALASAAVQSAADADARERALQAGVGALGTLLDLRDGYTSDHTDAVVRLCCGIGRALTLDPSDLSTLHTAARLHDLGKIGVPDHILHKSGPLTGDEWEVMRRHPEWGASALSGIPGFAVTAQAVRAHHERWDGEGYPDGLAGQAVPVAARIIAVCDAFHAMTSNRPYRQGLPESEAVRRIRAGAGSQFDPAVVDGFTEYLASRSEDAPDSRDERVSEQARRGDDRSARPKSGRFVRSNQSRRGGRALAEALVRATRLPALAEPRERALRLLDDDPVPLQELIAVIESSIALTVATLRAAGSTPALAVPQAVHELDAAALRMALEAVRPIDYFQRVTGFDAPEQSRLHAVATRRAADLLARTLRRDDRDSILTAALLHDVGKLVLEQAYEAYPEQIHAGADTPDERVDAERRELGMDHAALGGVLLRRWELSEQLTVAVERHHAPDATGAAAVVRLADMLAHYAHAQPVAPGTMLNAAHNLGIDPVKLRALMFELTQETTGRTRATRPNPLTNQEHAVLKGLATGKVYKEIGTELGIAASTVRTHCGGIYKKLDVIDRANAVLKATENGWI